MELKPSQFTKLLVRPVVIITTISENGEVNAAPFSFNTPVSFDPPLYAFASDPEHDTWINIKKVGEFVVNVAGKDLGEVMHILEKDFPYGVNELEKAGLAEMKSKIVKPPRVKEALGWIECKLEKYFDVGDHVLIIGRVLCVDVKDEAFGKVIDTGRVLCHISGEFFAQDMRIERYRRAYK